MKYWYLVCSLITKGNQRSRLSNREFSNRFFVSGHLLGTNCYKSHHWKSNYDNMSHTIILMGDIFICRNLAFVPTTSTEPLQQNLTVTIYNIFINFHKNPSFNVQHFPSGFRFHPSHILSRYRTLNRFFIVISILPFPSAPFFNFVNFLSPYLLPRPQMIWHRLLIYR